MKVWSYRIVIAGANPERPNAMSLFARTIGVARRLAEQETRLGAQVATIVHHPRGEIVARYRNGEEE